MKFDFAGRVKNAFGFVAASAATKLAQTLFSDALNKSSLNVDVLPLTADYTFDEVTLRHGLETYHFAYRSMADEYADVFATPPMLNMRRAKKLVITSVDNSDIEVVERYGTEPYEITMRGLLIDMENHQFPIDKLASINTIFEANREWMIDSEILQAVGVQSIFFRDVQVDFVEGYEDTIAYTMTARSITPVESQFG
jgi:hypothetical protein